MKLKYPISVDGTRYEELTLRRMKGSDMIAVGKLQTDGMSEAGITLALIALLCNIDEKVSNELDVEDIMALGELMESFFPNSTAGRKRSAS